MRWGLRYCGHHFNCCVNHHTSICLFINTTIAHHDCASILIGCLCAIFGTLLAIAIDGSIAGPCTVAGIIFTLAFLFSPNHGVIQSSSIKTTTVAVFMILLTIQCLNHQQPNQNEFEFSMNLTDHMKRSNAFAQKVISHAIAKNYITYQNPHYSLTPYGIEVAKNAMTAS